MYVGVAAAAVKVALEEVDQKWELGRKLEAVD